MYGTQHGQEKERKTQIDGRIRENDDALSISFMYAVRWRRKNWFLLEYTQDIHIRVRRKNTSKILIKGCVC